MSSIYYGDSKYEIPDFGDKLRDPRSEGDKLYEQKMEQLAQQKLVEDERAFALSDARATYNALEPKGPAWSPNDSQFYSPDDVPASIDSDLLPRAVPVGLVIGFGLLVIFFLKGK